jgi:hypothetical protein
MTAPPDEEVAFGACCPAGYVHLPSGADAEWVKQLVGEQLVTVKTKRGFIRLEWQKLRVRNEALSRVRACCRLDPRQTAGRGRCGVILSSKLERRQRSQLNGLRGDRSGSRCHSAHTRAT